MEKANPTSSSSSSSLSAPSVLIVGGGVFGTSTAYHLAQQQQQKQNGVAGMRITVVDRTPSPPSLAASTDINKIVRADYPHPLYATLAYEAIDAWATWPALRSYYHRTGWVMLDEADSDLAERIRAVFHARGHDPTVDVALAELEGEGGDESKDGGGGGGGGAENRKGRWRGCLQGTDTRGFRDAYWNPEAGWCEADKATASLMAEASKLGVEYVCGDVVEVLIAKTDGNERSKATGVRLENGRSLTADRVVLATGAWTSALLTGTEDELGIADADRVERQAQAAGTAVAHFKMTDAEMEELAEMPVMVYGGYGEVIPPPPDRLLKYTNAKTFTNTIETPSGHRISVPPPGRSQNVVSEKLQRETYELMMDRVMPSYARGKEVEYWRICWDARTPSQDWLLDRHPKIDGLYLALGGSFHSYKFLPNVGKYMANVLTGRGNGEERDNAWKWKESDFSGRGAHEKTRPQRELRDAEG